MKLLKISAVIVLLLPYTRFSQTKKSSPKSSPVKKTASPSPSVKENIPKLIPKKKGNRFGYINQQKKFVLTPSYDLAMFFSEDCNLLNSKNEAVRKYGTANYATVEQNAVIYRINTAGKKVYTYKDEDLGICREAYKPQRYNAYILNGEYGIIDRAQFTDPADAAQFVIYPQYQYLFILESTDRDFPMIVAANDDKFGIIDIKNNIVIPLQYNDIKRNYSWKIAKLFEVTQDDKTYFYIDRTNRAY